MEVPRLSALTNTAVDRLYGIDRAAPAAHPTFLFLVGVPGAGKSSGHAAAIDAGLLPENRAYVTVNMDLLLEAITPFRAASAAAHLLKQTPATAEQARFASISAYGSRKENLGLFKWYNTARPALTTVADPATLTALNAVREVYQPLADATATHTITEQSEAALDRAIAARLPIVYETTISVNARGRVAKIDALMERLDAAGSPYKGHIHTWHITGDPEQIRQRVKARQEYSMPADEHPFYRYVPTGIIPKAVTDMAAAFARLQTQYAGKIQFREIIPVHDATRLPTAFPYNVPTQRERITAAYLPPRLSSSWRVSSPRGSLYVSSPSESPSESPTASSEALPRRRTTARRRKSPSSSSSSSGSPPPTKRRASTRKAAAAAPTTTETGRRSSRLASKTGST